MDTRKDKILCINLRSFYYMKVQQERWERNKWKTEGVMETW